MAGLLTPKTPAAQEAEAATMPTNVSDLSADPGRELDDDEPNVSPEEQAEYEQFVRQGMKLIYAGGDVKPGILKMLNADPSGAMKDLPADAAADMKEGFDPARALAQTAVQVVLKLVTSAKDQGKPLDGDIILHGGKAIMEDLAEVADKANIHDFDEQEMTRAWLLAQQIYFEQADAVGALDKDALANDFMQVKKADDDGSLASLMPNLPMNEGDAP